MTEHHGACANARRGVAAIEFVLTVPVLLILFFGMVNLTHYISATRKISLAAELMTDLVTRSKDEIKASTIDDYFTALGLSFWPMPAASFNDRIGIDVYGYRWTGAATQIWTRFSKKASTGKGEASCTPPVITPGIEAILKGGANAAAADVVISVVCTTYTAPIASFPGLASLKDIRIEKTFPLRTRDSNRLNCNGC